MTQRFPARLFGQKYGSTRSQATIGRAGIAMVLAVSTAGCQCVPAPSGVAGWTPTEAGGGRTRIAGAVHTDFAPGDPAVTRASNAAQSPPPTAAPVQGPAAPVQGPAAPVQGPAAPPDLPAIPQPLISGENAPLGAGPLETTPRPAGDIRVSSIPPTAEYPIDLATALRLAERQNPLIGAARARIVEALGLQTQARVEMLPALNGGVSYDGHAGNLQRSNGSILDLSRQSLYFGGGAGTSAQNTIMVPAVFINEPLANALFDPLAAHQYVHVAQADAAATTNTVLLEVTRYYLELLGASARLEAERRSTVEAEEVMRINERYARAGEGRPADFHRAETEWRIRRAEVRRAEEDVAVASARLCRRLHLDPSVRIRPTSDRLEVLWLVDLETELEALIQEAIRRRPEVHAAGANLAASRVRLRQEVARPLLPSLFLGFSGGGFGGGSNLVPPLMGNFAGRTDFDVAAYWTLENVGFGNLFRQKQQRALIGAATARQARTIALVREEVASAHGDARARREQVEVARERLAVASEGFRRDLERAMQADPNRPGDPPRPIEVINSLKLIVAARRQLIRTIVDYDQAQFQLFVAMGSPPPLEHPTDPTAAPVSIASLSAPVTSLPAGLRPDDPNAAPPAAPPPAPGAAARDEPGSAIGRALADAESNLARTLERLGGVAGAAPVAELARAHQRSMGALLEYDRLQEELLRSVGAGSAGSADQLDRLMKLAEAHRKLMKSKVEYDETLWGLVGTLGAGGSGTRPGVGPTAPITRGGTQSTTTNTSTR